MGFWYARNCFDPFFSLGVLTAPSSCHAGKVTIPSKQEGSTVRTIAYLAATHKRHLCVAHWPLQWFADIAVASFPSGTPMTELARQSMRPAPPLPLRGARDAILAHNSAVWIQHCSEEWEYEFPDPYDVSPSIRALAKIIVEFGLCLLPLISDSARRGRAHLVLQNWLVYYNRIVIATAGYLVDDLKDKELDDLRIVEVECEVFRYEVNQKHPHRLLHYLTYANIVANHVLSRLEDLLRIISSGAEQLPDWSKVRFERALMIACAFLPKENGVFYQPAMICETLVRCWEEALKAQKHTDYVRDSIETVVCLVGGAVKHQLKGPLLSFAMAPPQTLQTRALLKLFCEMARSESPLNLKDALVRLTERCPPSTLSPITIAMFHVLVAYRSIMRTMVKVGVWGLLASFPHHPMWTVLHRTGLCLDLREQVLSQLNEELDNPRLKEVLATQDNAIQDAYRQVSRALVLLLWITHPEAASSDNLSQLLRQWLERDVWPTWRKLKRLGVKEFVNVVFLTGSCVRLGFPSEKLPSGKEAAPDLPSLSKLIGGKYGW